MKKSFFLFFCVLRFCLNLYTFYGILLVATCSNSLGLTGLVHFRALHGTRLAYFDENPFTMRPLHLHAAFRLESVDLHRGIKQ